MNHHLRKLSFFSLTLLCGGGGCNKLFLLTLFSLKQVVSINTPSEMFEYIEEDKVTTEMGGTLEFDANEWTQHRSVSTRLEKVIELYSTK